MKKITLMAILLSLALVACGEKKVEEVKEVATAAVAEVKEAATTAAAEVKETTTAAVGEVKDAIVEAIKSNLVFKTEDGSEYKLDIDGDNAILKTANGEEFNLKADVSGSGTRFADEKGNEIHFKGEEGIVKINGKEFNVNLKK